LDWSGDLTLWPPGDFNRVFPARFNRGGPARRPRPPWWFALHPTAVINYRPRSILGLILLGFGLVALPLAMALVTSALYVDRVTAQGQKAIHEAAGSIASSQTLVDRLTAMERNARQFMVLDEPAVLERYRERRCAFITTLDSLAASAQSDEQHRMISWVRANEQQLYAEIGSVSQELDPDRVRPVFGDLARDVRRLQAAAGAVVSHETNELRQAAARAQSLLFWQSAVLVPVVIGLAVLFVYLIVKPFRQVDRAVRKLGTGDFSEAIRVSGPRDLAELGQRLDWMRERLLELENQKVMFLRHMSHELKTPLASIREGTELLSEEVVGRLTPEQTEVADVLRANSLDLQRIIEGLLAFSISRTERPLAAMVEVDLALIARSVLNDQRLAMRRKDLAYRKSLRPAPMVGDKDKLRTIIDNLVSNAVKFSPDGGTIGVRVQASGDSVLLEVEDEGPGIEEEERERIFEAFFQGSAQHGGHVKGTGLGLSIVRDYVHSHHGEIRVEAGEKGALFRIVFPRVPPTQEQES